MVLPTKFSHLNQLQAKVLTIITKIKYGIDFEYKNDFKTLLKNKNIKDKNSKINNKQVSISSIHAKKRDSF